MTDYAVHISKPAAREIKKLTKAAQTQVVRAIEELASDPRPPGVEKLRSRPSYMRLRTGNYRIIYAIEVPRIVVILVVRDRKDAFKGLEDLDEKLAVAMSHVTRSLLECTATVGTA